MRTLRSIWVVPFALLALRLPCLRADTETTTLPSFNAWLEAKPACIFPLASSGLPSTPDLLTTAITAGLGTLAVTPARPNRVMIEPAAYPALNRLSIDLSDSSEDDDHKPPKINWHFLPQPGVRANQLWITARPLLIKGAKIDYELTAMNADLSLAQDRQKRPTLMLVGASHGHLNASISRTDVETLCLAAAQRIAVKYHFSVTSLHLNLSTPTDRSLDLKVDVELGGHLYGHLHFTGKFAVADDLAATASDLTCSGDGPGGYLIEGMVLPGLMFYDGKTKPLVVFPFEKIHLTDVRMRVDHDLKVTADFDSTSTAR